MAISAYSGHLVTSALTGRAYTVIITVIWLPILYLPYIDTEFEHVVIWIICHRSVDNWKREGKVVESAIGEIFFSLSSKMTWQRHNFCICII